MPLLRIAVTGTRPCIYNAASPLEPALRRALVGHGPVMILVHGYKFDPAIAGRDPHARIFGQGATPEASARRKALSWPRHLGFGSGRAGEGLCIAFGWPARGRFRDAYLRASGAGTALAALVREIRRVSPGRAIHLVGHSLGARVCLQAFHGLPDGSIGRAILLSGCEYQSRAQSACASAAGRSAEIINVTSRENDLFELMFETLIRPPTPQDRGIGAGLGNQRAAWLDLQLDHRDMPRALAALGTHVSPERRRLCHWSTYTRPGALAFYADLLRAPSRLPLAMLDAHLPRQEARFSRILPRPRVTLPLPIGVKRPS